MLGSSAKRASRYAFYVRWCAAVERKNARDRWETASSHASKRVLSLLHENQDSEPCLLSLALEPS